jgi:hypothetical protein
MNQRNSKFKKQTKQVHSLRKDNRANVIEQLKAMQSKSNPTSNSKIEALVNQADFYASFLLSKFETKK